MEKTSNIQNFLNKNVINNSDNNMDLLKIIVDVLLGLFDFFVIDLFWNGFITFLWEGIFLDMFWKNVNTFVLDILNPIVIDAIPFFVGLILYTVSFLVGTSLSLSQYDDKVGTARTTATGKFFPVKWHVFASVGVIVILELVMYYILVPFMTNLELDWFNQINKNFIAVIIFIILNLLIGLGMILSSVISQSGGVEKFYRSLKK
jgi:hypothetical protein